MFKFVSWQIVSVLRRRKPVTFVITVAKHESGPPVAIGHMSSFKPVHVDPMMRFDDSKACNGLLSEFEII